MQYTKHSCPGDNCQENYTSERNVTSLEWVAEHFKRGKLSYRFKHHVEKGHKLKHLENFNILGTNYRKNKVLKICIIRIFQGSSYIMTISKEFFPRFYCTFLIISFTQQMADGMLSRNISIYFTFLLMLYIMFYHFHINIISISYFALDKCRLLLLPFTILSL